MSPESRRYINLPNRPAGLPFSDAVLREAGMTTDDLVWVQVYSPDISLWQKFNAAYVKLFSREFPARVFGIGDAVAQAAI